MSAPDMAETVAQMTKLAEFYEREALARPPIPKMGVTGGGGRRYRELTDHLRMVLSALTQAQARVADLEGKLERAQQHIAQTGSVAAAWRRGVMFAVERLDIIMRAKGTKKAAPARLERIMAVLDELTEFQRKAEFATYQEAFRLSEDHNAAARRAALSPNPTEDQ